MDSGPVSHSAIFQRVMRMPDIEVITHVPRGQDGRRTTARAKRSNRIEALAEHLALFYDLVTEKDGDLPAKPEKSEWILIKLIQRCEKPIVLFVDDAHDLNGNTLRGLKRILERVRRRRGQLLILLAGHPKLRNDLRRPTMEEDRDPTMNLLATIGSAFCTGYGSGGTGSGRLAT